MKSSLARQKIEHQPTRPVTWPRVEPVDRVRNFSASRRRWEDLQLRLTANGWPARLARALGGRTDVEIRTLEMRVPALAGVPRPLRIAFASDFHASPTTHPLLIENACRRLAELRPDVLLLGGDFVCLHARFIDELSCRLAEVPAPFGKFAVLGNHDLWTDFGHLERRLESAGVQMVTNRNVRLPAPFDRVWLCGLDDHYSGTPDRAAAVAGADGVRVLLMHSPSGLLDVGAERFELALAGHTHGGQVALPGGVPVVVPHGELCRRYPHGVHNVGPDRTMVVSRGVGCSTIPFRLWSPPEIHLVEMGGR
jgi:uncharacterized protein